MLAERLGMTVAELLKGVKQPISSKEFEYWRVYNKVKRNLEEDAIKKARRKK